MSNLPADAQIVPAKRRVSITASANEFAPSRGIFIETAGSFTIQLEEEDAAAAITLPVGTHPFAVKKVTAGTGLWALY